MIRTMIASGLALTVLAGGISFAQPQPEKSPERPRRAAIEPVSDPAMLRARLERSIERNEQMLARHREALERLNAGDSPADVLRSMRWRPDGEDAGGPAPGLGGKPDGDGPRPGGEGRGLAPERVTPEVRERLRAMLRERLPSVDEQLRMVAAESPEMAERLFDRLVPQLGEIARDMDRDQRLGDLRLGELRAGLGVVDATRLYFDAPEDKRELAGTRLREAIGARFDARIAMRQYEVELLARRIGELSDQIREEMATRDDEIERTFQSIIERPFGRGGRRP